MYVLPALEKNGLDSSLSIEVSGEIHRTKEDGGERALWELDVSDGKLEQG
jgi:hypothetical protein